MTTIAAYLTELDRSLLTRGRARRRILDECRAHLLDAAQTSGEVEAVRRFGPVATLAAEFDGETAARRGTRSTVAAAVGVLAVAGSTLGLVNDTASAAAVVLWAVIFFGAAQTAAVSAFLAFVQVTVTRTSPAVPADLQLMGRRNLVALGSGLVTEFAAGAAVSGRGSTIALLLGPAVAGVALVSVLRAWLLARRLAGTRSVAFLPPTGDLASLVGRSGRGVGPTTLLVLTGVTAAGLAFAWNVLDHGSLGNSVSVAAVEVTLVVAGFLVLGRTVGVRPVRRPTR